MRKCCHRCHFGSSVYWKEHWIYGSLAFSWDTSATEVTRFAICTVSQTLHLEPGINRVIACVRGGRLTHRGTAVRFGNTAKSVQMDFLASSKCEVDSAFERRTYSRVTVSPITGSHGALHGCSGKHPLVIAASGRGGIGGIGCAFFGFYFKITEINQFALRAVPVVTSYFERELF